MPASRDPIAESVWGHVPRRSQRRAADDRADPPGLSREQIVSAAVALLDADGAAGLSMRKLGQRLGSGTTSVYWHVANKGELIDLAVDRVLGEVPLPDAGPADWRDELVRYAHGVRDLLLDHGWIVSVISDRPNVGPNSTALSDRMLGALESAGFTLEQASYALSALSAYALGNAIAEVAWQRMQAQTGMSADELTDLFGRHYESLSETAPNFVRWWKEAQPLDVDAMRAEAFDFGLQRQLDGLEVLLSRTR